MVQSTRRFVLPCIILTLCFSVFSNAITSLGKERANLSAFRTFVLGRWPAMVYLPHTTSPSPPSPTRGGGEFCRPRFSESLLPCKYFTTCKLSGNGVAGGVGGGAGGSEGCGKKP